jgi:hypothetical protein
MNSQSPVSRVTVSASDSGLSAIMEMPDGHREVFMRAASPGLSPSGDAALALVMVPAMRLGGTLDIAGPVSSGLLTAVQQIQDVFLSWDRAGAIRPLGLQPVDVRASTNATNGHAEGVGCFFSGGVDSFYTLLRHREEITDLVVVHGFDIALEDARLRRALSEAAADVAQALGMRVIEIETDARQFGERYVTWNHYFGCMLVAIAYGLAHRLGRIYLGTGHTYATLLPDGANPILDAPWSRGPIEIVSDGAGATRTQKVAALAAEPLAMRWLRVCWENHDRAYNCGRCEKCLRTKVALQAVGALELCRMMPGPLDRGALYRTRLGSMAFMWREMLRDLELMHSDPALVRDVRRTLGPHPVRRMYSGWYRLMRSLGQK